MSGYISALKNYLPNHVLDANVIKKFKKDLFKLRPPKAKYHAIWDVNILLNFLENIRIESDMDVSRKLVCLFMLLSDSRVNSVSDRYWWWYWFIFDDVLKHSRPSFKEKPLVFRAFSQKPKFCPISTLIQYLDIRLSRWSDTALFLTTVKPYKGASRDTIACWIKNTMQETGINTALFSPHSCRSAATSKVNASGTSITTILQSPGWSRTSTFKKFYLMDIQ